MLAKIRSLLWCNNEGNGGLGCVSLLNCHAFAADTVALLSYSQSESNTIPPVTPQDSSSNGGWIRQKLPEKSDSIAALVTWHRLKFELPSKKPSTWLPWLIRLHATGNGFIYCNGHAIGRYCQDGKQSDFYLPECWLNFGPENINDVEINLRPTDKPAGVESAEVIPYTIYAEHR